MVERLTIATVLLTMGYLACCMLRNYILWRAVKAAPIDPLLTDTQEGIPIVVYFTTPTCAPCKYAQRPALNQLQQEMGEAIQIIHVDATQDPDAATRWHVQTVPTTFILDGKRQPKEVNHGVADLRKLRQQLQAVKIV